MGDKLSDDIQKGFVCGFRIEKGCLRGVDDCD